MKKNVFRTLIITLIIITIPFPAFADYGTIEIDGYYDDWEDKPHTEVYPGNNPPQSKINYVSLFRDESNVYVHVEFAYKNNQDITNMTVNLYTNLGNESYFIVPDYFYYPDDMDSSEPDMAPDQSNEINTLDQNTETDEQETDADQEPATESTDDNTNADEDTGTEPADQNTDNNEQSTDNDEGNGTKDAAQDLLSNSDKETYFVAADNENKKEKKTEEETQDPAAEEEKVTDTTDLNTNNDQGTGTDLTEEPDNEPGDLLDLFDSNNIVDLDNVLEQFETDATTDTNTDSDLNGQDPNMDDQNSNLNLKKPGWYGTWAFNVYKDRHGHDAVGSGYYTRTEGEPDELELYIPLSSVTHQYEGITEISMKIKKLGPQYIMCVGASSEPYIGVVIGAGIAMLSVGAYSYKKKRMI